MARKEEFQVKFIKRMTEETLDITTTEGKQDFVRNLVAYNIILEGIWFYSGFMVALSSASGTCCATSSPTTPGPDAAP